MSFLFRNVLQRVRLLPACGNILNTLRNAAPSTSVPSHFYSTKLTPYEIVKPDLDKTAIQETSKKINEHIKNKSHGRLFAVVQVAGKQFKITDGDVIVIEGYWPPDIGDQIRLDKVLVVGAEDFSLIGRPLVQNGLVNVVATVIEKTLSHTKPNFKKLRRKQFMRIRFYRIPQTMLRINKIELVGEVNNPPQTSDVISRSF